MAPTQFIPSADVSVGMRDIFTEREIGAPPADVWAVLTDLGSYREWNPLVTDASGRAEAGERIAIRIQLTDRRPAKMSATVTVADPPRKLEWVGRLRVPGLFTGRHTLELEPLADGRTRLRNRERASGLLVPLVVPRGAAADYEAMNRALADRVAERAAHRDAVSDTAA